MTRPNRTDDEAWAIDQILSHLRGKGIQVQEDTNFTDAPDLVVNLDGGKRIACEFCTVSVGEWHKWQRDKYPSLQINEIDTFVLPRQPDIWIEKAIQMKEPKVPAYLKNTGATEAWLVMHSSQSSPHDFFFLDADYDLPLLTCGATSSLHSFSAIFVVSSNVGVAQIYPGDAKVGPLPADTGKRTIRVRAVSAKLPTGGVLRIPIGAEYKPTREVILPPLDRSKNKADMERFAAAEAKRQRKATKRMR